MKKFAIPFKDTKIIGDMIGGEKGRSVLLLHGAGTSNRKRFQQLRLLLAQHNVTSCAFDFIGHGETGGDLTKSSLSERTEQALTVAKALPLRQPLNIIASSMSGYIAIKLSQLVQVQTIILLAGAVYTPKAYKLTFANTFTETIRKTGSWKASDAWEILKKFKGTLLIFEAQNDEVIPRKLTQRIYDSADSAGYKKIVTLKKATHPLGKYLEEHPETLQTVLNEILKIIT